MMNTMKMLLAVLLTLSTLAGCATTTAASGMGSPVPPTVAAPLPPSGPAMAGPMIAVPPARPESMMGPPQNWAWLHTPPYGCERGSNSLLIANDTNLHMRVMLDGEELMVRGAHGVLPTLPPNSSVYVCLSHLGMHTISGVGYTLRYGVPQEVASDNGRFTWSGEYGSGVLSSGRHEFHINAAVLILM